MSDVNKAGNLRPDGGSRMNDEFIARVLSESGRRTPPLNPSVQANILKAMMVENARLIAVEAKAVPKPLPQPSLWDSLLRWLNPPVARGLGGAFAAVLMASLYVLFGGSTGTTLGTVSGDASLRQARTGIFGWQWSLSRNVGASPVALRGGDQLTALVTTTVVLADNSQIVLSPGGTVAMKADGSGVMQLNGEVAYAITPSADGKPKFAVETADGNFVVKGTEFRIRRDDDTTYHYTDEGRVGAVTSVDSADVVTGEQVRAKDGRLSPVELQVPIVAFDSASPAHALTNRQSITLTARIFPGATLVVVDGATGRDVQKIPANAVGEMKGELATLSEGAYQYRFYVTSPDGRKSAQSPDVKLDVDRTSPSFTLEPLTQNGDSIIVRGTTEPNVRVAADGQAVMTGADGSFELKLSKAAGLTVVGVVFTDEAGNTVPAYVKVP